MPREIFGAPFPFKIVFDAVFALRPAASATVAGMNSAIAKKIAVKDWDRFLMAGSPVAGLGDNSESQL
jgi:hypothetical protein